MSDNTAIEYFLPSGEFEQIVDRAMNATELYRHISDDEYRGEGFFEGVFQSNVTPIYDGGTGASALAYYGDHFILEDTKGDTYLARAVWVKGDDGGWRDPTPAYAPGVYRIPKHHFGGELLPRWTIVEVTE
jgi:hypothetical protein